MSKNDQLTALKIELLKECQEPEKRNDLENVKTERIDSLSAEEKLGYSFYEAEEEECECNIYVFLVLIVIIMVIKMIYEYQTTQKLTILFIVI